MTISALLFGSKYLTACDLAVDNRAPTSELVNPQLTIPEIPGYSLSGQHKPGEYTTLTPGRYILVFYRTNRTITLHEVTITQDMISTTGADSNTYWLYILQKLDQSSGIVDVNELAVVAGQIIYGNPNLLQGAQTLDGRPLILPQN